MKVVALSILVAAAMVSLALVLSTRGHRTPPPYYPSLQRGLSSITLTNTTK